MNYYKRHLGDYAKKAGHLSPLEHGVYTLLLDAYYDREQGPTRTEAIRWCRARTEEEIAAVDAVLAEFFDEVDGRFIQTRVEEEILSYHGQLEANRLNGIKGGRPKKTEVKPIGFSVGCETEAKETLTINHKPITNKKHSRRFSDDDLLLAEHMFKKIEAMNPGHKEPNLETWADEIRKIRMLDGKRIDDIRAMFDWANTHSFWRTNILSPPKLREKWDMLAIQRANGVQAKCDESWREGVI